MIKHIEKNKIMMISHVADIDGMGSVILARKYYQEKIDYILCEVSELELAIDEDFSCYDIVYICDLELGKRVLEKLSSKPELEAKIKHFDHHCTMLGEKVPSYFHAQIELHGRKTCGTELFYTYLLTLPNGDSFSTSFYQTFVEAIRELDTWDFKEFGQLGKDLGSLLSLLGQEAYMEFILSLNDKDSFLLPPTYTLLLRSQEIVMEKYIDQCDKNLYITDFRGHKVGVTISEQYHSFVGNQLSLRHKEIDYVFIIKFPRMSCSLRTVKETIDLAGIALSIHPNGGGHRKAASFAIDSISFPVIKELVDGYLSHLK